MARKSPPVSAVTQRDLMLTVARNPRFCCCCFRLSREDRRRAKRVFRLTRRITRAWKKEQRQQAKEIAAS